MKLWGGAKMYFSYDGNGDIMSVNYIDQNYYYVRNPQGDVVALVNESGEIVDEYTYDAWGKPTSTPTSRIGQFNPFRYRGYIYDDETGFYYLGSRYYDPEVGRFLNADDATYLGIDGTVLSNNLFAYCKNNPVVGYDPTGNFCIVGAIIATGAIVGGLLGAFSAAATGGNVLESIVEGCLTGAIGATCGIMVANPIIAVGLATLGGATIDFATQATVQYKSNKSIDVSKIDYGRVVKTGIQTGISTSIPAFGEGAGNAVDAFGTALIWAESSVIITCTDIVITNAISSNNFPVSKSASSQYTVVFQNGSKYVM